MKFNKEQMLSLLRTLLKIVGTVAIMHGTLGLNGAMWEYISGVILTLAPVIWDMTSRTDSAALATVEAMPDVKKIVVSSISTDGVANAAADPLRPKVVTGNAS